jgi:hypothetical protein
MRCDFKPHWKYTLAVALTMTHNGAIVGPSGVLLRQIGGVDVLYTLVYGFLDCGYPWSRLWLMAGLSLGIHAREHRAGASPTPIAGVSKPAS